MRTIRDIEDFRALDPFFRIETASRELDWLNRGVFVGVGGRQPSGVIYETYLVA